MPVLILLRYYLLDNVEEYPFFLQAYDHCMYTVKEKL